MKEKVTLSNEEWADVVVLDGKHFNLNDPQDIQSYWYELQKEQIILQ